MKRRSAIKGILATGAAGVAAYSGYWWYDISKSPELARLTSDLNVIAALADTIIPRTDSPGAKDADVHHFIVLMLNDCTDKKTTNRFIDGLQELKEYTKDEYGKTFLQCSVKEREAICLHIEKEEISLTGILAKVERRLTGRSFFQTLKYLTCLGFANSEMGATQGLEYVFIPGTYRPNIPIQPNQKSWATE